MDFKCASSKGETILKKHNYKLFCLHIRAYDRLNIAYGMKDLVRLAKKYNCPIPKKESLK